MHLKLKVHCFGVLLVYTITTIILSSSVGWCEPAGHFPQTSLSGRYDDRSGALTRLSHPSSWEARRSAQLDSESLENGTETTTTSRTESERTLEPKIISSTSDKSHGNRYKRRHAEGETLFSSHDLQNGNCSKGFIKHVFPGKFYIPGHLDPKLTHLGFQSDSTGSGVRGEQLSGSEESWQKLEPVVECGENAMTLTVRRRRAVQLLLDRANESSLSLFQLPPQCGYEVHTSWRDLSLTAQYDACHISQEDDGYVLPLLWRGTPVKVTCPVSQIQPPAGAKSSLCCSPIGMTVTVKGESVTEEPRINVGGEWTPLVTLAEQCDYTLDRHDGEIVIAVPFITCGISVKDGKYTLSLEIGERIYTLACPVSPTEELPIVYQPLADGPPDVARKSTGSLAPLPWIPPFYLAPPYYPHPTFDHNSAHPKEWDLYNPPTQPSLDPEATSSSQDLPPVRSQSGRDLHSHQILLKEPYEHFKGHMTLSSKDQTEDSSQVYPDKKQNQDVPVSVSEKDKATTKGFPAQLEGPHSQPPSHDFSPFYHYYHHPKIPLPPKDLDPGISELLWSTSHHNEFPSLPSNVQQSKGHKDDLEQISPPKTTAYPYTLPTNPKFYHTVPGLNSPYPSELFPYLYYYYYFPHITRGEAKRLGLLHPDLTEKANLSYAPSLPVSSHLHGVNLHMNEPKTGKNVILSKLHEIKRHSSSVTPAGQPPILHVYPPKPSLFSPGSVYDANPYHYYYHPYYGYYMMYYKPEGLLGTDGHLLPSSSKTLSPLHQASSHHKHQSTTPPSESTYLKNGLLHPYYYYHFYHQPKVVKDVQELHPPPSKGSAKTSTKFESRFPSNLNYGGMQWFNRAPEAGYPRVLTPHNPFYGLYSYYAPQQHPPGPFGQHGGYDAKEKVYSEMRDQLKANLHTPGAPPCGFGPVSDVDCSKDLGCCSHTAQDGTAGQYFVFGLPDSVVEPKLANPVPSSESSNVSCMLQKLTSDPDVYIVPLNGCGVNKHVFGQTVVHLLEVEGLQSNVDGGSADENSPVRLMVGCISYPDTPGEVMFQLMDQPHLTPIQPAEAPVTVLRLATDESFTSFYPEAHLPLGLVQERPVYAELSLLNPSEPNSVLLVHSCLAYTLTPYLSWILFYDGCPKQGVSQLLPSPDSHHIRRIKIINFPSFPLESSAHVSKGGSSFLEDSKVYFLCLTEMCSSTTGDCSISCTKGNDSDQ